jgi:sugar lactone lactonase YvrE
MNLKFATALVAGVILACAVARIGARPGVRALEQSQPLSAAPETLVTLPFDSEGLTVDPLRQTLYTAEAPDASGDCIVRRITMSGAATVVGVIPKPLGGACGPRGLEFRDGNLYIADQGTGPNGWVFEMDPVTGQAAVFAAGVPGANGIVFDSLGNLWITDSLRGLGRVYRRQAGTGLVEEVFRVPPVGNGTLYGGLLTIPTASGIGRQVVNLPVGIQPEVKQVANGIAVVERYGDAVHAIGLGQPALATLYVADTARGAIWAVQLDEHGDLVPGQTGCNPTLQDNTLCEDAVFVAHPRLEGADGMIVDADGSLWITANSRQGIVRVDRWRNVTELFRNPLNSQLLRSSADTAEGNRHILEYPSNPVFVPLGRAGARTLCVTSIDRSTRDNWPGTAGEIGGPGQNRGKVSCF